MSKQYDLSTNTQELNAKHVKRVTKDKVLFFSRQWNSVWYACKHSLCSTFSVVFSHCSVVHFSPPTHTLTLSCQCLEEFLYNIWVSCWLDRAESLVDGCKARVEVGKVRHKPLHKQGHSWSVPHTQNQSITALPQCQEQPITPAWLEHTWPHTHTFYQSKNRFLANCNCLFVLLEREIKEVKRVGWCCSRAEREIVLL